MSMEIPAGKWCGDCPFLFYRHEEVSWECWNENVANVEDEPQREARNYLVCKSGACLTAYPNGAVIEIKPK